MSKRFGDLLDNKKHNEARLTIDSILNIANHHSMIKKTGDCYLNYALINRSAGDINSLLDNLKIAIAQYTKAGESLAAAKCYTFMGQTLMAEHRYQEAVEDFKSSFYLREKANDSLGMANNLINLAGMYYQMGQLTEASDDFYRALRIAGNIRNNNLKAICLSNLSNIHTRLKNFDKSHEYLLQAIELYKELKNRKGESNALMNLGISYFENGNLKEAKKYFEKTMVIKTELKNDDPGMIKIYNNLGVIAKHEGDTVKAINYYMKSLRLSRKTGDKQGEATALNNLGSLQLDQANAASLSLLRESLEKSKKAGLKKLILINYGNLRDYFIDKENYKEACSYAMLYQALADSVLNEENAATIIELQTRYDTEMKEKENQILRSKASILKLRNLLLLISVVAIAILAVLFIFLYSLKRKSLEQNLKLRAQEQKLYSLEREKSEKENKHLQEVLFAEEQINKLQKIQLQEKSRELSASAMHIINKNEFLGNIRQLAAKLLNGESANAPQLIKKVIREIDSNINLDEQWEQFKLHFESVHTGFFARLMEHYPALTQNELKLCAYLRMNLTSKEIAQMLNISIESATTKRYRLRKKLMLSSEENLSAFIAEF